MEINNLDQDQVMLIEASIELFIESIEASELVLLEVLQDNSEMADEVSIKEELDKVRFMKDKLKPVIEQIQKLELKDEPIKTENEKTKWKPKWVEE